MSLQRLIEHGLGTTDLSPEKTPGVADKIQVMLKNYVDLCNKGCPILAEEMYKKEEKELLEAIKSTVN